MLGRKASEAAAAASAFASSHARRIADTLVGTTPSNPRRSGRDASLRGRTQTSRKSGRYRGSRKDEEDDNNDQSREPEEGSTPFGFLDTMCGPMFGNGNRADKEDDGISEMNGDDGRRRPRGRDHDRSNRGAGGRSASSFDYDDETNITDMTGSYDDDDETYDDDDRVKSRLNSSRRGRDRKPRARSPTDSPSEMTGPASFTGCEDDMHDDTDTEFSSAYDRKDKDNKSKLTNKGKSASTEDDATTATGLVSDSEKLITQPLASGFAKRCYFTKAGIGRTTQHYEGLTLTGNTVLMLAAAMKLKGCPTICDEDLRRVEQTYPNQFSRLPDELLLSSGWRRISKYCHFSHKPLPDGVPFFHSRRRCHPNGGFYFLLCSAVGMTRLMDVEPLNRDALAVLQTDFPVPCESAPNILIEDPEEWTLVNKFCFFSGGPINVEEDVYYRAELGGTEIYMLAFLSPSLSPEELYRLSESNGNNQSDDITPLRSVAAVEEVESVYDLTERDFDDLKLYHLGPCRALPPYLLHPEAWTKVLPPHFVAAREEALRRAREWENRYPATQLLGVNGIPQDRAAMSGNNSGSGYVELGGGGRGTPAARASMAPMSPGFSQHNLSHLPQQSMSHDPSSYYPSPGSNHPYPPQNQLPSYGASSIEGDMGYYYGISSASGHNPALLSHNGGVSGGAPSSYRHVPVSPNPYSNQSAVPPSPVKVAAPGPATNQIGANYDSAPAFENPLAMSNNHWRDIHEEGAFGMSAAIGGDQPDDEALAAIGGVYGVSGGQRAILHPHQMIPIDPDNDFHATNHLEDPTNDHIPRNMYYHDDTKSVRSECSGTSSVMRGAQEALKKNRLKRMQVKSQRPDLATKLAGNEINAPRGADDSTWDTRTEGESSYGTSMVSGSSVYTDTTNPIERNSRRALILQMAKARMKNVKQSNALEKKVTPVEAEPSVNDMIHPQADNDINGENSGMVADLELD